MIRCLFFCLLTSVFSIPLFSVSSQSSANQVSEYANTAAGLQSFLDDALSAAKLGDRQNLSALVKRTEIPNYRDWYYRMYPRDKAESWIKPYGADLQKNEEEFQELFLALADTKGRITTRKLKDDPSGDKGLEWAMLHSAREPLDIYFSQWEFSAPPTASPMPIGYFIFIDGMFGWDSLIHFVNPKMIRLGNDADAPPGSQPANAMPPLTLEPENQSVDPSGKPATPSQTSTSSVPVTPIYRVPSEYAYFTAEKKPTPLYPQEALDKGLGGDVILVVEYAVDGHVTNVQRVVGDSVLAQAGIQAASAWRFLPIVEHGQKSRGVTYVGFHFLAADHSVTNTFPFGKWQETPPDSPPSAASRPKRVRINSGVAAKNKLAGDNPRYPQSAKSNRIQGEVNLRAVIDEQGNISLLEIVKTPSPDLAISAIEAVKTWHYQPYILNGEAAEVETILVVLYTLS